MKAERSNKKKIKIDFYDWDVDVDIDLNKVSSAAEKAMDKAFEGIRYKAQKDFRKTLEAIISFGMNQALDVSLDCDGTLKIKFDLDAHGLDMFDMSWKVNLQKIIEDYIIDRLNEDEKFGRKELPDALKMRDMFLMLAGLFDKHLSNNERKRRVKHDL